MVVGPLAAIVAQNTYLRDASQLQSLSFSVHIPLVCFGIALPALIAYFEWRFLRTGDELYRTIARRWTRIMAALFAIGVITGTILSFEMGMLWPGFMSTFGGVFGLGFSIEGFSFFLEAIFIGIYVYGWNRLSQRLHFLCVLPIVLAGFTGSLMVIAVNAWMQHPSGFRLRGGHAVDVHPLAALFGNSFLWNELIHMYVAGFMVTGFLMAAPYAVQRLRGRWDRYQRTAFTLPFTVAAVASPLQVMIGDWVARDVGNRAADQARRARGPRQDDAGRARAPARLVPQRQDLVRDRDPAPPLAARVPFLESPRPGPGLGTARRPAADQHHPAVVPGDGRDRHTDGARRRRLPVRALATARAAERTAVLRAAALVGPLSVVALIAGWVTTEVGRQPWVVYKVMTTTQAVTPPAACR